MEIGYLGDHSEFADEIAELWVREWSGEYSKEKVADQAKKNRERYGKGNPPFIIIAFDGDELIGTSALLLNELENRPEYDIWLGGLLVKPEFRNKGIAKKLMQRALDEAKKLGYSKIYLKTEEAQEYYDKLGWTHTEHTKNKFGRDTDVYFLEI